MTNPSLSMWMKIFITLGSFLIMMIVRGDAPKPDRMTIGRDLIVTARALKIPKGNVDIATGLSLRLVNAWDLTSANNEFGGLSALFASGTALTFLSDQGALVRLNRDPAQARWSGVIAPVPMACGDMHKKEYRDTESLAHDPRTGTLWIAFEERNAICRLSSIEAGGSRVAMPPLMSKWPDTGGPEAMVRLRDGSFLIFEEFPRGHGPVGEVIHFDRDPVDPNARAVKLAYRPPTGYRPVDAAQLPDGRLLVLNRRFEIPFAFTARLSIVDISNLSAGHILAGPIVARLEGQAIADNYEALAIDNDGRDLSIWIASDDNFMSVQRTLLLRFVWPMAGRRVVEKPGAEKVEAGRRPR
jgi:hypothetical protein